MIIRKEYEVIFRRQISSDAAVSSLDSNPSLISEISKTSDKQCH
jgi:hypothetical protein